MYKAEEPNKGTVDMNSSYTMKHLLDKVISYLSKKYKINESLSKKRINESSESTSRILSKMKNIMGWWDPEDEDREYVSNVYDPSKYVDRSKDTYCGIPAYGNMNWMIREKWIPTTYITSDEWEDGDGAYHETYEPVFLSLEAAVSPDRYKRKTPYRYLGHSGDEYWPAAASEKDIWEGELSEIITKYID